MFYRATLLEHDGVNTNLVIPQQKLQKAKELEEPFILVSGVSVFCGNEEQFLDEDVTPKPKTRSQQALFEMEKRVLDYEKGCVFRRPYLDSEIIEFAQLINSYDVVVPTSDFKKVGKIILSLGLNWMFSPKLVHICCHEDASVWETCWKNNFELELKPLGSKKTFLVHDKSFRSKYRYERKFGAAE
jgi:hypothetical protein